MTPASGPQQRLEQIERHRRGGPADQLCEADDRCGRRRLSEGSSPVRHTGGSSRTICSPHMTSTAVRPCPPGVRVGVRVRVGAGDRARAKALFRGRVYRAHAVRRATGAMRHSRAAPTAAALPKERPNSGVRALCGLPPAGGLACRPPGVTSCSTRGDSGTSAGSAPGLGPGLGLGLDPGRRTTQGGEERRERGPVLGEGAYTVKGGEIGGFGGGWLEHPRQWLGAQWPDLSPWVSRNAQSRQARPEEAQELPRRRFGDGRRGPPRAGRTPWRRARAASPGGAWWRMVVRGGAWGCSLHAWGSVVFPRLLPQHFLDAQPLDRLLPRAPRRDLGTQRLVERIVAHRLVHQRLLEPRSQAGHPLLVIRRRLGGQPHLLDQPPLFQLLGRGGPASAKRWQYGWGLAALSRHWPEGRMQAEPQGPVPQRRLAALLQLSGGFFGAFFFGAMAGRAERYMTRATTTSQGLGGPAGVRAAVRRYGEARQNGTTGTGGRADTLRPVSGLPQKNLLVSVD
eukprot:scaffold108637_cov60-Phaeocystis_antarctica.AAC.3